ncbi:MAG TPA: PQQ-binding-like beta-propeller repeat protein [Gaiellaceae bacterium]|nr:PQQ-binding-like beta-propeller repeat protein [Gaiellaceae bacterium]
MHRLGLASLLGLTCLALLATSGAIAGKKSTTAITPSPTYTAAQLGAPAGDDWLVHFGNLKGHRYSSLTQINKQNVSTLKQVWHIDLGTCPSKGTACGSMESNAVVANGIQYTQVAPLGDVFAIDGATGAVLWKWTPTYDTGFNVGTGGRRAGVAIGEGKVFAGTTDGRLYGLDQVTGKVSWVTEVADWKKGGKIASAPIYVNGMVLTGSGAGDNGGNSATVQAFSAGNGRRLWSWSVVPAPGQPGYKTWSQPSNSGAPANTLYGGGAMWESTLIDPKLNLAIIGTGNPVPWNSRGPGENFYTDSIVALNLYTGQLVWFYQTTHHDLWDSDLPNNGVMFSGKFKVNGKMVTRPGVAYVNKYGMTFILDRQTGKPLLPIPEVKVPVSTSQDVNSWPTQPIPMADNVLFNKLDKNRRPCVDGNVSLTNAYVPFAQATAPDGKPYKIGCVYDPYDTTQYVVLPFEMMDWPASSYSPENHTFITCGVTDRARAMEQIPSASQVAGAFGGLGVSQLGVSDPSPPTGNSGNFSALNVLTGKLTWHQHWPAVCYSGSANTASGLTFVGHWGSGNGADGKGYLEAVDTKTGASLWNSGPLSAPVGAAPVTYTVNGKQYVSVEVGGAGHNDVSRPAGLTNTARLRGSDVYTWALP